MNSKNKKPFQQQFFKPQKSDHGGDIKHPQMRGRPLSVNSSMHLVLRSSQAIGPWSFKKYSKDIHEIITKFANKFYIDIKSYANVGNHLHFHLKLYKRRFYAPFIRAITSAIMMKVTGFCQWRPKPEGFQFWDQRPFTRIIQSYQAFKNLLVYIQINILEGLGVDRKEAEFEVKRKDFLFESG